MAKSSCSFLRMHDRAYLACFEENHAARMARHVLSKKYSIVPLPSSLNEFDFPAERFVPSSLTEIYKFDEMVQRFERNMEECVIVFSAGRSKYSQRRVAFLIGCHLIISKCCFAHDVYQCFCGPHEILGDNVQKAIIMDCWKALHKVRSLAWIDFRERFTQSTSQAGSIDMEEFMHYSRCMHDIDCFITTTAVHFTARHLSESTLAF